MAYLEDLINRIDDAHLRERVSDEVKELKKWVGFGLKFERHEPEAVAIPGLPLEVGGAALRRAAGADEVVDVVGGPRFISDAPPPRWIN